MFKLQTAFIAVALMLAPVTGSTVAAKSSGPIETYQARLSARDHFNSRGVRLTTAAGIIRQDRANFHEFGYRDDEDTSDAFFAVRANRARLEQLILNGHVSRALQNRIVNTNPLIEVEIYPNRVEVTVL